MDSNLNVCVVDDDEIYQFTMKLTLKALSSVGSITSFNDGGEAIDFMLRNIDNESQLPDVIFLDINMPVMDGFQFMEEYVKIKPKLNKKITIYMVSSSVDPVDIKRADKIIDISDYIVKPIEENQLKSILSSLEQSGKLG